LQVSAVFPPANPGLSNHNIMSTISSVSSSSSSDAAAIYRENLARVQTEKQAANAVAAKASTSAASAPVADVDHDGDSQ
jgi:hypothetical protein